MPLFVNAEKLPYGGWFGVIEQNRPYQTLDLFQKNEPSFSSVCRTEAGWLAVMTITSDFDRIYLGHFLSVKAVYLYIGCELSKPKSLARIKPDYVTANKVEINVRYN